MWWRGKVTVVHWAGFLSSRDKMCPFLSSAQIQLSFYNVLLFIHLLQKHGRLYLWEMYHQLAKIMGTLDSFCNLLASVNELASSLCYAEYCRSVQKFRCHTKSCGLHRSCRSGWNRCSFQPNCRNIAELQARTRPSTSAYLLLCPSTMITECHLRKNSTPGTSVTRLHVRIEISQCHNILF